MGNDKNFNFASVFINFHVFVKLNRNLTIREHLHAIFKKFAFSFIEYHDLFVMKDLLAASYALLANNINRKMVIKLLIIAYLIFLPLMIVSDRLFEWLHRNKMLILLRRKKTIVYSKSYHMLL